MGVKVLRNVELGKHEDVMKELNKTNVRFRLDGLDFGFSVSYNAFTRCFIDMHNNYLYIWSGFYNKDLINSELTEIVHDKVKGTYMDITADNARPELIEEIRRKQIRIKETKKGKGSNKEGIQKVKSFKKIIVSEEMFDCYKDLKDLTFKTDKDGNVIEDKFSWDSHWFDSVKYAIEDYKWEQRKHGRIDRGGI